MNRPSHCDPDDDELLAALVAYDEALATGQSEDLDQGFPLEDEYRIEWQGFRSLLDLMESVWPRCPITVPGGAARMLPATDGLIGQIGRFRIHRELGRGGFGVVYLAHDPKLNRQVALKLPRPEMLVTEGLRQRFLREARATAALDHPRILSVFETGEIGSVCYLISPYCAGGTLGEYLANRDKPLSPRQAARLTFLLAEATHYAHTRGVLHRDLKPANVLVESLASSDSDVGDLEFAPRITDFGLAQFIDAEVDLDKGVDVTQPPVSFATRTGAVIGTPRYMAPETIEGDRSAIGPATDVYGLGVILYETLTGTAPFSAPGKLELMRQVLSEVPTRPSQVRPDTPRDLEAICLKCLEKRPAHRYASAGELAADLNRFLQGQPTVARPLTNRKRMLRWMRQHPVVAGWSGAAALVVIALLAGLTIHSARIGAYAVALEESLQRESQQKREADFQRRLAEDRELAARQQGYASEMGRAWRMWQNNQGLALCELLNHHRPAENQVDIRGFEWHYLWSLACNATQLRGHLSTVQHLRFARDSRRCASWTGNMIYAWDLPTRSLSAKLTSEAPVYDVQFNGDATQIISVCGRGTIEVWELESKQRISTTIGPSIEPWSSGLDNVAAISPNGKEIAYTTVETSNEAGPWNELHIWNLSTGESRSFPRLAAPMAKTLLYSHDGNMVIIESHTQADDHNFVQFFDAVSGALIKTLQLPAFGAARDLALSPDQRTLLVGTWYGGVLICDLQSDAIQQLQIYPPESRVSVGVSADGLTYATASTMPPSPSHPSCLSLWRNNPNNVQAQPPTTGSGIRSVRFSPDGKVLAYVGERGLFRCWNLDQHPPSRTLNGHDKEVWCVAFSPQGGLLASTSDDHSVKLWDITTNQQKLVLSGHDALVAAAVFSPDSRTLATSSFDGTVKLWDVSSGKQLCTFTGHQGPVRSLAFYAEGKLLATVGDDQSLRLWDVQTQTLSKVLTGHQNKVRAIVSDDAHLITADNDGLVHVWNTQSQRIVQSWKESEEVQSLTLSRDHNLLATGSKDGLIRVYSFPEIQLVNVIEGAEGAARALAFAADGQTLASGGEDHAVTLWHVVTGQQLFNLPGVQSQVNSLAFSRDGHTLAAATHDGAVTLWQTHTEQIASDNP